MRIRTRHSREAVSTLIASFLHFDLSFMLWVMIGALSPFIAASIEMSASQKALMVAVPILSGSLLRMPLGVLSDRVGGKLVGLCMLIFLFVPLALGWQAANGLRGLLAVGLMLGSAGASFAVALPLASRWYPARRQGLVMGIAAAGNSGTVIANLAAPRLATIVGWHNVFALAAIPLAAVVIAFELMAKDSPDLPAQPPMKVYFGALKQKELWWFCGIYAVTFGGYVGLSSYLPTFFKDQYHVSPVTAGYLTAAAAFVGSAVRPLGGYLADRIGGARLLLVLLLGVVAVYGFGAALPGLAIMFVVLLAGMACLGMGNGATFQLVPQRFNSQVGIATGVIGAVGGTGGFLLPMLLGSAKQLSGSFGGGFVLLSVAALGALVVVYFLPGRRREEDSSWSVASRQAALEDA
ncbi:MAG TPA: nitrate/nitrite transporter [Blastocatellia bacterium]|nr:nitrate/nitrite transporter [Blastocatellia bacterium]